MTRQEAHARLVELTEIIEKATNEGTALADQHKLVFLIQTPHDDTKGYDGMTQDWVNSGCQASGGYNYYDENWYSSDTTCW